MSKVNPVSLDSLELTLDDRDVLWRYIPLRTLLLHLARSVFIPSVDLLQREDPLEGVFHFDIVEFNTAFYDRYGEKPEELENWIHDKLCSASEKKEIEMNKGYVNHWQEKMQRRYFEFLRKTRFAWCWFQSNNESALMWNSYGHQGAAVASTVGKLKEALGNTGRDFLYSRMQYVPIKHGKVQFPVFSRQKRIPDLLLRPYFW